MNKRQARAGKRRAGASKRRAGRIEGWQGKQMAGSTSKRRVIQASGEKYEEVQEVRASSGRYEEAVGRWWAGQVGGGQRDTHRFSQDYLRVAHAPDRTLIISCVLTMLGKRRGRRWRAKGRKVCQRSQSAGARKSRVTFRAGQP